MKPLMLLLLLTVTGCNTLPLDVHDADSACAGDELEEYNYRDKKINISVKCK